MLTCSDKLIMKNCFLFSGESDDSLQDFCSSKLCELATFSKGDTLFGEAKSDKNLGLLLDGRATALCSDDGKSSLKSFSAGELFGAASVFCDLKKRPFSKITARSACKVLYISREGVEKLIYEKPERAVEYIRFLSGRVEFLNRRISTFTSKEATERVARFVLDNADTDGVCRAVNSSALAKSLDISRASLYRARSELVNSGVVTIDGRNITVIDRDALENIL